MRTADNTPRRGFLARAFGAAAALTVTGATAPAAAEAQAGGEPAWIKEVPGKARCFFDCPQHANGFGLLHIMNYLGAYQPGQAGVVSSFYSVGSASSIALAFNDAMWAKYALGDYLGLKDASGKPYTRNVFASPTKDDGHLLTQRIQMPLIPLAGEAMAGLGILNLQKMGTKFLLCNNAFGLWTLELEAKGKGAAAALGKDFMANLLPGVTAVPAMVQAIQQAQAAGFSYNRQ